MDIKEIKQELGNVVSQFRDMVDKQEAEIKKYGEASGETKSAIDKMNERMNQLETKLNRPAVSAASAIDAEQAERKAAFNAFLRKGLDKMTPEQIKTMTVSNDATGGYLAPTEMLNEMLKNIVEFSPIRSVARIRTTNLRAVKIPKKTGNVSAAWVTEIGARPDSQSGFAFGLEEVPVHEMSGYVDISNQDLEDPTYNLEQELNLEFSEQFGKAEGTAFVGGNSVGKPQGILFNSSVLSVNSGAVATITADGLIDLLFAPKTAYASNGKFLLNRPTLKEVRQLKDGNGQYLWQPGLLVGKPNSILDKEYIECIDMPDEGVNTYPIAFGDFKKGYMIIDRLMMEMMRDPYTQATTGTTRFIARKRVGGQVILPEAIYKLKCSV
jgi:HK97 family phage major capsid protein